MGSEGSNTWAVTRFFVTSGVSTIAAAKGRLDSTGFSICELADGAGGNSTITAAKGGLDSTDFSIGKLVDGMVGISIIAALKGWLDSTGVKACVVSRLLVSGVIGGGESTANVSETVSTTLLMDSASGPERHGPIVTTLPAPMVNVPVVREFVVSAPPLTVVYVLLIVVTLAWPLVVLINEPGPGFEAVTVPPSTASKAGSPIVKASDVSGEAIKSWVGKATSTF